MDREPDDRLGRSRQRQRFEQRRQILRAGRPHTNANAHGHGNTHRYANADAYPDGHAYGVAHTDAYVNGVTKSYSHAEACTDTEAAPDSATSPVGSE